MTVPQDNRRASGEPPVHYFTTDDGVRIAYRTWGSGVAICFLPLAFVSNVGLDSDLPGHREGYPLMASIGRFVRYDPRGCGLSSVAPSPPTIDRHLADLEELVARIGAERLILVTLSDLFKVAIRFAHRHPGTIAALVGVGPHCRSRPDVPLLDVFDRAFAVDPTFGSKVMAVFLFGLDRPHMSVPLTRIMEDAGHWHGAWEYMLTLRSDDVTELLPTLSTPLLIAHQGQGSDLAEDRFDEARTIASLAPHAQLIQLRDVDFATPAMWESIAPFIESYCQAASQTPDASASATPGTFRAILFTDIVASTPLLAQLKDAKMREVMRDHDEVLTAAVTGHGGRVVKTIGDAFMAEFAVPSAAVEAAIEAQRAIRERFADADVPVRLRIGINAGEPIEEGGDLHGTSVVIAKRLESAADVNGILVSDVVKQMVAGKEFDFEDRGLLDLKGFDEPVRAWAVRWEDG